MIVVFFDNKPDGDYLDVIDRTESLLRGWVVTGHWTMVIDLVSRSVFLDQNGVLELLHTYDTIQVFDAPVGNPTEMIEQARRQMR